jgi:hypothetical protein
MSCALDLLTAVLVQKLFLPKPVSSHCIRTKKPKWAILVLPLIPHLPLFSWNWSPKFCPPRITLYPWLLPHLPQGTSCFGQVTTPARVSASTHFSTVDINSLSHRNSSPSPPWMKSNPSCAVCTKFIFLVSAMKRWKLQSRTPAFHPALPLTSCVTLGRLFLFSVLQFPYLQLRCYNSTYFLRFRGETSEFNTHKSFEGVPDS